MAEETKTSHKKSKLFETIRNICLTFMYAFGITVIPFCFLFSLTEAWLFVAPPQSSSFPLSSSTTSDEEISFHDGTQQPLPLHDSLYTQVLSTTLPIATKLRQAYDEHFQDPREPKAERFVFDPWFVSVGDGKKQQQQQDEDETQDKENDRETLIHVQGEATATAKQTQYSLKRVQTSQFFSSELYEDLVEDLIALGRSVGLTAITPPWTSMYTENDMQNFHTDAPHGPLAFVLSLCQEGDFHGGETIMLNPNVLEFWKGFDTSKGMECGSIIRYIPPTPLGRCIAFDPRVPHGVNRVIGNSQDPRKARVVIHGWFNEPETCWFGPWTAEGEESSGELLDQVLQPLVETLGSGEIGRVIGYLAVRVEVDADGSISDVFAVCDTLRPDPDDFRGVIGYDEADRPVMEDAVADVRLSTFETLKDLTFDEGEEGRAVIVPFAFE